MIEKKNRLIGKIHSSQGLRGHLFVVFKTEEEPWIKKWKTLSLSVSQDESPRVDAFIIQSKREHSKQGKRGWVIALQGVDDKTAADALVKQWVWIPESFLTSKKGEKIFLHEIENFMVKDKNRGDVGPIVGFASNGVQDLIQIKTSLGLFDVPLVEPFIEKIDYKTKTIHMDIPLGLLEEE